MTEAHTSERTTAYQVARTVTYVFSPVVLATLQLFAVPVHAVGLVRGLGWGLFAVAFVSVAPLAYILVRVRRRTLSDVHIRTREHRRVPFIVGLVTVGVGLVLLALTGAPRDLLALVAAFVALTIATIAITSWWKISVHAMVAMMTAVILAAVYGPALIVTVAAVALIGWARVELRDHTVGQVLAGALLGLGVAGLFVLAR
ncbi:phosphoesterase PA-phosphatase [Planosporangium thailandense]|uniref:Phosphoesterase PA-phosphatase n=1 Tax=Planosporangium thailandense TaxID=765197 RepID=A0ABX0XX64_9ACTN|nr:phosphoesterase PA-phosphatase [Planosporangium thailandense]NJC70648.1 phosphoesterase PA-phosphatase [Planosporangium thailandense]